MAWPCPTCGYAMEAYSTEANEFYIKRYRKCRRDPNHPRVTTIEIDMEEFRHMNDVCTNAEEILGAMRSCAAKIEKALLEGERK